MWLTCIWFSDSGARTFFFTLENIAMHRMSTMTFNTVVSTTKVNQRITQIYNAFILFLTHFYIDRIASIYYDKCFALGVTFKQWHDTFWDFYCSVVCLFPIYCPNYIIATLMAQYSSFLMFLILFTRFITHLFERFFEMIRWISDAKIKESLKETQTQIK